MNISPMINLMQSFFDEFDDEVEKFLNSSKSKLLVNYSQNFPEPIFESFKFIKMKKEKKNQVEVLIKEKNNGRKKGKKIF